MIDISLYLKLCVVHNVMFLLQWPEVLPRQIQAAWINM